LDGLKFNINNKRMNYKQQLAAIASLGGSLIGAYSMFNSGIYKGKQTLHYLNV
jgi:hypothetical protein